MIRLSRYRSWIVSTLLLAGATSLSAQGNFHSNGGPGLSEIDHSEWNGLLGDYVVDGLVNYGAIKKDARFRRYIEAIGQADATKPASRNASLAFWINAYNAITIEGVLRRYPDIESVRDIWFGRFFSQEEYRAAGEDISLNTIEHEILRKMSEPRIHFSIVCASISCPNLQSWAYEPASLDSQLTAVTGQFLSSSKGLTIDRMGLEAQFSAIFDWFGEDFEKSGGIVEFAKQYLTDPEKKIFLASEGLDIEFQSYDWSLNVQRR